MSNASRTELTLPARLASVFVAALAVLAFLVGGMAPGSAKAATTFTEIGPALLADGTSYGIRVPTNPAWNGTVINDLDYVGARNGTRSLYWLGRGYAVAGIQRHPNRRYQYDPVSEVQNLFTVLDILEANFGKPTRVIAFGTSAGGQLALAQAELFPDRVHGAVAGCATTPLFTSGIRYDAHFIVKALLAPNDPMLIFLGGPDDSAAITQHWQQVITAATQNPAGRARLALAFAVTQWPVWTLANQPKPNFIDNGPVIQQIMLSAVQLPVPAVNTQFLFETQVGVWIGNEGADFLKYFQNAEPWTKRAAEQLYKEAGLNLQADLNTLQAAARSQTPAGPSAFWHARNERTQRGTPQVPVFRYHTIGDPQAHTPQMQVYNDQIKKNGKSALYRTGYTQAAGHCNFTVAEHAAAMEIMIRRLDTGQWQDTSARSLNGVAASLNAATGAQNQSKYIEWSLRPFNGEWRFDYQAD